MRILSARIFSKFLAGKIRPFKQKLLTATIAVFFFKKKKKGKNKLKKRKN